MEKKNKLFNFRKKFLRSKTVGGWIQLSEPNISKLISEQSYLDWICLDLEHGLIDAMSIPKIVDAVEKSNKIIFARISYSEINNIPKILDYGVDGIIIASIKDEKDIKKIYSLSNYPPRGKRGLGFTKYNNFRLNKNDISNQPLIIPMIENIKAYKNLNNIIKEKKYFDGLFVGPVDLSLSIGDKLKFSSEYKKTILNIKKICKQNKVLLGIHLIKGNKKDLNKIFKEGFNFVAYLTDTVVLQNY